MGSGTSKGRKAIHRKVKKGKGKYLVNKCLLGHIETMGFREWVILAEKTAKFFPVYHTYFILYSDVIYGDSYFLEQVLYLNSFRR